VEEVMGPTARVVVANLAGLGVYIACAFVMFIINPEPTDFDIDEWTRYTMIGFVLALVAVMAVATTAALVERKLAVRQTTKEEIFKQSVEAAVEAELMRREMEEE
jgi:protein-S-isoprenylcysteine O-methyltransferase Ste14